MRIASPRCCQHRNPFNSRKKETLCEFCDTNHPQLFCCGYTGQESGGDGKGEGVGAGVTWLFTGKGEWRGIVGEAGEETKQGPVDSCPQKHKGV